MSALEQEIIERLKHLSEGAKLEVLHAVKRAERHDNGEDDELIIIQDGEIDGEEWLTQAKVLRESLLLKYGHGDFPSATELLREIRDEEA